MLENIALQGYRKHTQRTIAYAKYKIGSNYYDANISHVEVSGAASNVMSVYLNINPPFTGKVTVSEICLYDTGSQLFLKTGEAIELSPLQEGLLYVLTFEFKEEEVS